MTITDRTSREVASTLARLREEYGSFTIVDKEWVVSPSWYEFTRERVEDGAVGGAGAWVHDTDGQVLLVQRRGEERWEEPGGKHEPGETLEETARREAREEAGIECEPVDIAQAHRITVRCERPDGRPDIEQVFVIFRATYTGGKPEPREGEIATVRWWDHHPENLHYDEVRDIPIPASQ